MESNDKLRTVSIILSILSSVLILYLIINATKKSSLNVEGMEDPDEILNTMSALTDRYQEVEDCEWCNRNVDRIGTAVDGLIDVRGDASRVLTEGRAAGLSREEIRQKAAPLVKDRQGKTELAEANEDIAYMAKGFRTFGAAGG